MDKINVAINKEHLSHKLVFHTNYTAKYFFKIIRMKIFKKTNEIVFDPILTN